MEMMVVVGVDGCDGGGRVVMVMAVLEMVGVMVNWWL